MRAILMTRDAARLGKVYSNEVLGKLKELFDDFDGVVYVKDMIKASPEKFKDTEFIFSTWGIEDFTKEEIETYLPNLKCLFHAAGSVQRFARPFLNCGVRIFSAWAANAIPVAEYTVAQIILANKGILSTAQVLSERKFDEADALFRNYIGNYKSKIGIIGAGMIGKKVIELLKAYDVEVFVYDPFLPDDIAEYLGVKKVSLETLFSECNVISNHLADNEKTKGMFNYNLFSKMVPYSSFINTGRGAQVVQDDLIKLLNERPDVTAFLDVTFPEPLPDDSELYNVKNCYLTPHIAGSSGNEFWRLSEYMIEQYDHYINDEPCEYEVTMNMLKTMA